MRFDAIWIDRNSIVLKYLQGTLTKYDTTATSPIAAYGLEEQTNSMKGINVKIQGMNGKKHIIVLYHKLIQNCLNLMNIVIDEEENI